MAQSRENCIPGEARGDSKRGMILQSAEAIAQQQRAEIELIYATAPIGLCFVDTQMRFVRVNEYLAAINGVPVAEHLGRTLRDILPEQADALEPLYQQVIESGEPILNLEFHGSNRAQPGVERDWLVSLHPLKQVDGCVQGVNVMVQEITDRKQTEAALHQSNAILNTINASTPTLIYVKDRQGRLLTANPALLAVVGKPAESVLGKTSLEFHTPREEAEKIHANDRLVMETGQPQQFEEGLQSVNGWRVFLSIKSPFRDRQGNIIGIIGISSDITERKHLEREQKRLLQCEQTAREAAERANQIKDEFLAVLSHELRSPLNPILGWTKLLQMGSLSEDQRIQALATIERNARLQAQLIEDLLDISRIMRGKLCLSVAPTNLTFVISAAMETVRLAAEAKAIDLRFTILDFGLEADNHSKPSSVTVQSASQNPKFQVSGDAARLQQVMWNLLTNAVKFTPSGGRVTVTLTQTGNMAQIQVADTGKGIHPDFLPHVFEYFRQEDGSTTRKFGGLGLGLAIVRQIVEMHGGTVSVTSLGENQGTTFTVQLPVMQQDVVLVPEPPLLESALTTAPLEGIQVLLIDDDRDTREFQTFLLEQSGAEVITASSASEALQLLDQFTPDILLSDIGMPDMDGYLLMQQIRARPTNWGQQVPAIALTAYASELDQQKALQVGFQSHISKPVDGDTLIQLITQFVQV